MVSFIHDRRECPNCDLMLIEGVKSNKALIYLICKEGSDHPYVSKPIDYSIKFGKDLYLILEEVTEKFKERWIMLISEKNNLAIVHGVSECH